MLWRFKVILNAGYPLTVGGVCLLRPEDQGICKEMHESVVHGYKIVCNDNKTKCKTLPKVQNSWGLDFVQNYGEWFKQDVLIGEAGKAINFVGVIAWLDRRETAVQRDP